MKNRIIWLDVMKGITIFFVVLGHVLKSYSLLDTPVFQWIQCFYMSFFFMLSGFLARGVANDVCQILLNKVRTLIIPFIACGLIYSLAFNQMEEYIYSFFHAGYWFLLSLFTCWLIFLPLQKLVQVFKLDAFLAAEFIILIIPFFIFNGIMKLMPVALVEICSLNMTLPFYRFVVIGYILGKVYRNEYKAEKSFFAKFLTNKNCLLAINFSVFAIISLAMISHREILKPVPETILQVFLCMSLFGCLASSKMYMKPWLINIFSNWGKNSLAIYVLHFFLVSQFPIANMQEYSYGIQILMSSCFAIITIYLTLAIASPILNNKYLAYIILGQKNKG